MVEASKAYVEAMSLTIKFLITENDRMAKDLQEAMQRVEKFAGSAMTEMKKVIVAEISTLEATMRTMYRIFFIMHKVVIHLYGFQRIARRQPKLSKIFTLLLCTCNNGQ